MRIADMEIKTYRAPNEYQYLNYGDRKDDITIDTVVIHYTASTFEEAYKCFTKPRNVSVHYLIDKDGRVEQLVDDFHMAWHAGKSSWHGDEAVNNFSIGIALVNSGSEHGVKNGKLSYGKSEPFSKAQMTSLCDVLAHIKNDLHILKGEKAPVKNPDSILTQVKNSLEALTSDTSQHPVEIKDQNIVGHSDVTAYEARKFAPGVFFDWKWLAEQGHGLYPQCDTSHVKAKVLYKTGDANTAIQDLQSRLQQYGYKIDVNGKFDVHTENVVRAFNMHFHTDNDFGYEVWDNVADMQLNDLLHQIGVQ